MTHPATIARDHLEAWRRSIKTSFLDADPHLVSLLRIYGRDDPAFQEELRHFGVLAAGAVDDLTRSTNRLDALPVLERYDAFGRRQEGIRFHPDYVALGRLVTGAGMLARYETPGHELESLALVYLLGHNGEAGHGCPVACAAGLIRLLEGRPGIPPEWLKGLRSRDYDHGLRASQFLTEIQGGSDVGKGAVRADPEGDHWRITGEKWFCSVVDADLFLVTARVGDQPGTDGIHGFVVPRRLADGTTNHFRVRRLKDKLGTRSMASAEIDFEGAVAVRVAPFKDVVEIVLNTSRLYNAVFCIGSMQRAFLEARGYAQHRVAFGRPIGAFPPIARLVAGMNVRAWGARAVTLYLADLHDRITLGHASDEEALAFRALVNLNKVWTALAATKTARDGIEVLGGNGAIEDFSVLPRLLRDAIVCEAWEGGHNVLFAQVLKDAAKLRVHEPLFAVLRALGGPPVALSLDRLEARFARLLTDPTLAALHARDVLLELEPIAQAAILLGQDAHPTGAIVADHLLVTAAPDYDPLTDAPLAGRIAHLSGLTP